MGVARLWLISGAASPEEHIIRVEVCTAETEPAATTTTTAARDVKLVSAPAEMSPARARWEHDMLLFKLMLHLMYCNRLSEAEEICADGMAQLPLPAAERIAPNGDRWRDTRGVFAMLRSLYHATRGIMGMERDNLSGALPGLVDAEALLAEAEPWVAVQLMRGVCEVTIGVLKCLQHRFVSGIWHLLKAYSALRHVAISSLLDFEGMERDVVRSLALFFLGSKALILDLVPPAATRWLPGFNGVGDRLGGLAKLRQCVREGGLFKPQAGALLLIYHASLKDLWFLGWTDADWAECRAIEAEATARFGRTSLPYSHHIGLIHACRRDCESALSLVAEAAADPNIAELTRVQSALRMEQCKYHVCLEDWTAAAQHAQTAVQLLLDGGKRSGVPALLYIGAKIHFSVGHDDAGQAVLATARDLQESKGASLSATSASALSLSSAGEPTPSGTKRRARKKWAPPDLKAFERLDGFGAAPSPEACTLLALQRLALHMWSEGTLRFLQPDAASAVIRRLEKAPPSGVKPPADAEARAITSLCCALIHFQQSQSAESEAEEERDWGLCKARCQEGIALLADSADTSEAAPRPMDLAAALMHWHIATVDLYSGFMLCAHLEQQRAATLATKAPAPSAASAASSGRYYFPMEGIKVFVNHIGSPQLVRVLKARLESEYTRHPISAGDSTTLDLHLSSGGAAVWEWACDKGGAVDFAATFDARLTTSGLSGSSNSASGSVTVSNESRAGADMSPSCGVFEVPSSAVNGGTLRLTWSAPSASGWRLRSAKATVVQYRVAPIEVNAEGLLPANLAARGPALRLAADCNGTETHSVTVSASA